MWGELGKVLLGDDDTFGGVEEEGSLAVAGGDVGGDIGMDALSYKN